MTPDQIAIYRECTGRSDKPSGFVPQWAELLRDLDRLQHACIRHRERDWLMRTDAAPSVIDDRALPDCTDRNLTPRSPAISADRPAKAQIYSPTPSPPQA
jgi:hypothetical protein